MTIKLTYDPVADALALQITGGRGQRVTTKQVTPDAAVDLGADGRVLAFELLNASAHAPKEVLAAVSRPSYPMVAEQLEREFGLAAATWRKLAVRGRVPAKKVGRDWVIERVDAVNYLASRSPRGRLAEKPKARRPVRGKAKGAAPA